MRTVPVACGLVPPIDTAASAEERSLIEADGKAMRRSLVVPQGQEPPRLIGDDIPSIPDKCEQQPSAGSA